MRKDYYNILGVNKNATAKEIQKAYKKAALKYHPDKQVGKTEEEKKAAEEQFKLVAEAYECLSDENKKQHYDTFGTMDNFANGNGFNTTEWGNMNDPFEMFANMFGGGRSSFRGGFSGSAAQQQKRQPGNDVRMRIPVTIEDIFNGVTKKVKYKRYVRCATCHGEGGSGVKTCSRCGGTGQIMETKQTPFGYAQNIRTCPVCHGAGETVTNQCATCNGTGFKEVEEIIELNLPAGMQNGNGFQVTGKGSEAKSSLGSNGNFIAIVQYQINSDKYVVEGNDVLERIYIPYYDILLGCNYKVKLPNGKEHTLNIESCTPEGKVIRLYKEGINNIGDYYFEIHYQFPEKLSDADRKAMEQIKVNNVMGKQ